MKIGDKVFRVITFNDKWYVQDIEYIVEVILVSVKDYWINTKIGIKDSFVSLWVSKSDLFLNKNKAQKECDRRNGKE